MPRTVKLTSADARAWRENRAQWVSPKGFVLRAVTPEEEKAVFPALEQVKRFKQSGVCSVEASYKTADAASGMIREQKVPMEVVVRVTKTGRDQNSFLYDLFVNGNRYVKGRDVLRSRILEKHGECILQGPNGKQLTVLRDPTVSRPTFSESQRSAPAPERCHCRGFKDNPDLGRHHIACEWNMKAPPHERALPIQREGIQRGMMDMATPIASMRFDAPDSSHTPSIPTTPVMRTANGLAIHAASGSQMLHGGVASMAVPQVISGPGYSFPQSAGPVAPPGAPELYTAPPAPPGVQVAHTPHSTAVQSGSVGAALVSPQECENDCRGLSSGTKGWAWPVNRKPEPNQHHPLCKHADPWRASVTGQKRWMLYDLDRHLELREATKEEQAKAEVELSRNGIRSVQVGERLYAVVESGTSPLAQASRSGTSLTGTRMRSTPQQAELRTNGSGVVVTNRPASVPVQRSMAELSMVELEQELARRRALAQSELPGIPGIEEPRGDSTEETALEPHDSELAGSEEPSWGEQPIAVEEMPGELPMEAPMEILSPPMPPGAFIAGELPGLRNELGLVGLQQKPSTIEAGPVRVVDPEPFVDPLEESGPEVRFVPQSQPVGVVPTAQGVSAG